MKITIRTREATPHDVIAYPCHWEHDDKASYLVDSTGVIWQVFFRHSPDEWAGSIQRHETMGDNF